MFQRSKLKILLPLVVCFLQCLLHGQELHKITYGGLNGTQFNASFQVQYFLLHQGQKQKLSGSAPVIDPNNYEDEIAVGIQIKNLKVGLDRNFGKVKKSNHAKVFYLEAFSNTKNQKAIQVTGTKLIKIGSGTSKYNTQVDYLLFTLKPSKVKANITFAIETRIVDGIYDRKWLGDKFTKNVLLLPIKEAIAAPEETTTKSVVTKSQKTRTKSKRRYKSSSKSTNAKKNTEEDAKKMDVALWEQIGISLEDGNVENLLANCKLYIEACNNFTDLECNELEEVYWILIENTEGEEQESFISIYNELFPLGKYADHIKSKIVVEEVEEVPPITPGLARLDHDAEALVVNNVYGGKHPYYVGFYDMSKSKEFPVKKISFDKKDLVILFNELQLSEGFYEVKVHDAKGSQFMDKKRVFVKEDIELSKSTRLTIILILLLFVTLLYKKFVYF